NPVSDGLVERVLYPSGGETRYGYRSMYGQWNMGFGNDVHPARVESRSVLPDGDGGPEHRWSYQPTMSQQELTVVAGEPLGNSEVHRFQALPSFLQGMEVAVEFWPAGRGSPLKTIRRDFEYEEASTLAWNRGYNERVKRETVTLDGSVTAREIGYDRDGFV